jgi:hypothetical protein
MKGPAKVLALVLEAQLAWLKFLATRHGIYLLVAAAVILPYLRPLPLPFKPSPWAEKLYHQVERLEPGSHVLLAFDYSPGSEAELYPMSLAILRHCHRKDLIPIVMTHWVDGVGLSRNLCERAAAESGEMWQKEKLSGRDYVFLGYKPGYSNLVLNMGENLKGAFAKDYYDKPTQDMPALKGVDRLKDIDLAIDIAAGTTVEMWIAYGSDRFGFPLGAGCTAVMAPDFYPFLQSGQLVGFLGGLRGAADYEKLLEKSADATRGMQAQSVTHLLIIVLILAANAVFIAGFLRNRKGK